MAESISYPPRRMAQDLSIIRMQSQVMLRRWQSGTQTDLNDLRQRVNDVRAALERVEAVLQSDCVLAMPTRQHPDSASRQ